MAVQHLQHLRKVHCASHPRHYSEPPGPNIAKAMATQHPQHLTKDGPVRSMTMAAEMMNTKQQEARAVSADAAHGLLLLAALSYILLEQPDTTTPPLAKRLRNRPRPDYVQMEKGKRVEVDRGMLAWRN
ncbi:hypothetical protein FOZ60_013976 [Perkinsus olseni]|uniref:Uncharacterized protein n=1 Tax=Perkinsus olseni TaxID=32597 RepID=A0A7J6PA51_PEROL|nr:hypothetical protein FOZ60_013976 [Perkinsus olseni]